MIVRYQSQKASEFWQSTSGQIQDGGCPQIFNLCHGLLNFAQNLVLGIWAHYGSVEVVQGLKCTYHEIRGPPPKFKSLNQYNQGSVEILEIWPWALESPWKSLKLTCSLKLLEYHWEYSIFLWEKSFKIWSRKMMSGVWCWRDSLLAYTYFLAGVAGNCSKFLHFSPFRLQQQQLMNALMCFLVN